MAQEQRTEAENARQRRLKIRKARAEEFSEIMEIFAGARRFMAEHGNAGQWTGGYPDRGTVERDLMRGQLYVCTRKDAGSEEQIAAVFVYYIGEEAEYADIRDGVWQNDLPYGVVHRIAAADRARGIGAAAFCLDWAFHQCGNLRVDTHEKNIPMQNLLKKCGFSYCGRIHTSYGERIAFQRTAHFILASASPRRKELVQKLPVSFVCDPARAEELVPDGLPAAETAPYLAQKKAEEVYACHAEKKDTVVIGADTVVLLGEERFGKPADEAEAAAMLRRLSGTSHTVSTGVCIRTGSHTETFTAATEVTFYPLTDKQIDAYIASGEPMDKAGAYGIQGEGALFVREIRGDYYTVMGLPVAELWQNLLRLGLV